MKFQIRAKILVVAVSVAVIVSSGLAASSMAVNPADRATVVPGTTEVIVAYERGRVRMGIHYLGNWQDVSSKPRGFRIYFRNPISGIDEMVAQKSGVCRTAPGREGCVVEVISLRSSSPIVDNTLITAAAYNQVGEGVRSFGVVASTAVDRREGMKRTLDCLAKVIKEYQNEEARRFATFGVTIAAAAIVTVISGGLGAPVLVTVAAAGVASGSVAFAINRNAVDAASEYAQTQGQSANDALWKRSASKFKNNLLKYSGLIVTPINGVVTIREAGTNKKEAFLARDMCLTAPL